MSKIVEVIELTPDDLFSARVSYFKHTEKILTSILHAVQPECPAYPGVPNPCDYSGCDCFAADELPERVEALREGVKTK